jgi:hypothetical protein
MMKRHKRAGGRPPKFREPRRPITVTLPDRTLRQLASVTPDRARAIVKVTDAAVGSDEKGRKPVEVVEVSPGMGLIVVGPSRSLKQIPWLRLAEIAPARYLLAVPSGTAIETLEVEVTDLLEGLPVEEEHERQLLTELRSYISKLRRGRKMSKAELLFIET